MGPVAVDVVKTEGKFGVGLNRFVVALGGAPARTAAVFGLAQGNGILMINHCEHLEWEEGETFGPAMVIRAARERLAPILMTTLATGLALVPLLFYGDTPGREIEHPLAVAIIGGLVTSALLTLFVLPSLYLRFGRPKDHQSPGPAPVADEDGVEAQASTP